MKLLVRDQFPEMIVKTTKGEINIPKDYKGKWFVLFSHPADFTPVCTTEFVAFQKRMDQFKQLNTELIGLSVDCLEEHRAWIKWIGDNLRVNIEFPIIDDKDKKISKSLGMIREDAEEDSTTARSVVVVDFKGTVRTILEYPKELGRNMDEILRIVKGLQLASGKHLFAPANWPHNEIIGDKVLVPANPDLTDEDIKRQGICKLSDWFMYKNND